MNARALLDTLDDFLTERDGLFAALSRANLLLTRFKLNCGPEAAELLAREFPRQAAADFATVRNRHPHKETAVEHSRHPILTKADQVNELRTVFAGILHNRIIPLAALQRQLEADIPSQ